MSRDARMRGGGAERGNILRVEEGRRGGVKRMLDGRG